MTDEQKDRRPTEFLAGLGHALRTPLNGILGMSELLLESELAPQQRQFAVAIHDSGVALLELAKDVLDLSRLQSEPPPLAHQRFDPGELLRDTTRAYILRANARRIELQVYADDLPSGLVGDGARLRQVVAHLLSNALLQTDKGRIAVAADIRNAVGAPVGQTGGQKVELQVRVTDTGRGVPESVREHVFEPFASLAASTSGKPAGSGLALAVAHRTVALMGGTMGFESWEGSGATFWFRLPFERAVGVEDSTTELTPSYPAYAEPWPDVDLAPEEATHSPAQVGEGQEPSSAPLSPMLEPDARHRRGFPDPPDAAEKHSRSEIRILVAEDNPVNQLLAVHQLGFLGFTVEAVGDGEEVLTALAEKSFDLVLMDCEMPRLDGYETTRRLRASDGPARHIPIVAVTAHADTGERERCLRSGMNDYLAKPYREKDLIEILDKNLRRGGG